MKLLPLNYAVRNLGRTRLRLVLSVLGSALVVLLIITAGAFVHGMDLSLRSTGDEDNVIIMGAGSEESVERSEVDLRAAGVISASIPGIRERGGVLFVSPEVHVQLPLKVRADQPKGPLVMVRGVTPTALLVHGQVRLEEGRWPSAGRNEVAVGGMVHVKIGVGADEAAIGKQVLIDGRPWEIVGRFTAPGTVTDAEVWTAIGDLKQATKRSTDSCVVVTLDRAVSEASDAEAFTKRRLDLELSSLPERAYYAKLSAFYAPVRATVWVMAALVAFGGVLGGLNTMYAAFASRVRELGTLRALGFRRGAIVLSLVQEACMATGAGSLIACAAAVWLLDGLSVRFSLGAFGLRVDPVVLGLGIGTGVLLGVIGALPPAWNCLRLPIPRALKAA